MWKGPSILLNTQYVRSTDFIFLFFSTWRLLRAKAKVSSFIVVSTIVCSLSRFLWSTMGLPRARPMDLPKRLYSMDHLIWSFCHHSFFGNGKFNSPRECNFIYLHVMAVREIFHMKLSTSVSLFYDWIYVYDFTIVFFETYLLSILKFKAYVLQKFYFLYSHFFSIFLSFHFWILLTFCRCFLSQQLDCWTQRFYRCRMNIVDFSAVSIHMLP